MGQDSIMFDETIEENLSVGLQKDLSEDQLNLLLNKVNLTELDKRTDKLGLKGQNVSGGQRQRLAIARALARNDCKPKILILDEATAALDGKNEEDIQDILNKILEEKNCTLIVVAHRLSTIKNAYKINVLADGIVKESGTHDELNSIEHGL